MNKPTVTVSPDAAKTYTRPFYKEWIEHVQAAAPKPLLLLSQNTGRMK